MIGKIYVSTSVITKPIFGSIVHCHHGKTDDLPMMSRPTDVLNEPFVCYQDLSEYVGRENIERGFPGEPALKRITKPKFQILPQLYGAATPIQLDSPSSYKISTSKHFSKS